MSPAFFRVRSHESCLRRVSHLAYDAELCLAYEGDEVLYFLSVGHLLNNLVDGVEDACLSVEDETVGVGDVCDGLLIHAVVAQYGGVDLTLTLVSIQNC